MSRNAHGSSRGCSVGLIAARTAAVLLSGAEVDLPTWRLLRDNFRFRLMSSRPYCILGVRSDANTRELPIDSAAVLFGDSGRFASGMAAREGRAVEAWRRRECSKEWSLLVMALTCPAYRCRKRLKLRKGNGTRACRGNVSKSGAAARWRAQSKVCMVKAVLPESQFPVAKGLAVANAADTLCHAGRIAPPSANCHQSVWDDHR